MYFFEYSFTGIFNWVILGSEQDGPLKEVILRRTEEGGRKADSGLRRNDMDEGHTELFSALAEPSRMRIVALLREGPLSVGEIADRLELRQPQASKHLKVLQQAGVVEVQAKANRRHYRLRPEPFREMEDWLAGYRELWSERFDRLDEYLRNMPD